MHHRLQPNQELRVNEELVSNNGWFRLVMSSDGSLGLYRTQVRLTMWVSNTLGQPGGFAVMHGDGNFVAYSPQGAPYWETGTWGHPGASVVLQDDGNLVVYDSANNPLWASNTAQDLLLPTIRYSDQSGYSYNETSESWKELCRSFPCFATLHWPGYATGVVEDVIGGQPVVIQLWKGWCPKFLGFLGVQAFPGGIGAEVGVYRRIPGKARPTSLPFLPTPLESMILNALGTLGDDDLWWPFPELGAEIEFTLTNPLTNQRCFSAGSEKSYWLAKWMDDDSYSKYQTDQGLNWQWLPAWFPGNSQNTPSSPHWDDYILDYKINGISYPTWSVGSPSPRSATSGAIAVADFCAYSFRKVLGLIPLPPSVWFRVHSSTHTKALVTLTVSKDGGPFYVVHSEDPFSNPPSLKDWESQEVHANTPDKLYLFWLGGTKGGTIPTLSGSAQRPS